VENPKFNFLRSTPEDNEFHSQRIMFWVIDNKVISAPPGTTMSHLEMAETMGWLKGTDTENFFNKNPRGFYLKKENCIHFYRSLGFGFDEKLEKELLDIIPQIATVLNLGKNTKVYLGPKDKLIKGVEYQIKYIGKIKEIDKK
jgi:hypothetical protein